MSYSINDPEIIAQAARDAAELIRCRMAGDDEGAGDVIDISDLPLVADLLANLVRHLLTADADLRDKITASPERLLAAWEQSFGPKPAERLPRIQSPHGLRGDPGRDAVALIDASDRGDVAAMTVILASADHVEVMMLLAGFCTVLAHDRYGDDLTEWLANARANAERMDTEPPDAEDLAEDDDEV